MATMWRPHTVASTMTPTMTATRAAATCHSPGVPGSDIAAAAAAGIERNPGQRVPGCAALAGRPQCPPWALHSPRDAASTATSSAQAEAAPIQPK